MTVSYKNGTLWISWSSRQHVTYQPSSLLLPDLELLPIVSSPRPCEERSATHLIDHFVLVHSGHLFVVHVYNLGRSHFRYDRRRCDVESSDVWVGGSAAGWLCVYVGGIVGRGMIELSFPTAGWTRFQRARRLPARPRVPASAAALPRWSYQKWRLISVCGRLPLNASRRPLHDRRSSIQGAAGAARHLLKTHVNLPTCGPARRGKSLVPALEA